MDRAEAMARVAEARVARLATMRPRGRPHLVPITFALVGDDIVTAIDEKPKTTRHLQRLANIEANPEVSFLVDRYSDDWEQLWWVRVDGLASIHADGEIHDDGIAALVDKYSQYRERAPDGPLIAISQDRVASWESKPASSGRRVEDAT